jgi:hypothetical protein
VTQGRSARRRARSKFSTAPSSAPYVQLNHYDMAHAGLGAARLPKTSVWGKAQRVLRLLLALSNPRIAAAMVRHGFSKADLDEGSRLLRALHPMLLDAVPLPEPERAPLEGLFAWEHEWIPIARATLRRHFPTLHRAASSRRSRTKGSPRSCSWTGGHPCHGGASTSSRNPCGLRGSRLVSHVHTERRFVRGGAFS